MSYLICAGSTVRHLHLCVCVSTPPLQDNMARSRKPTAAPQRAIYCLLEQCVTCHLSLKMVVADTV